MAGIGALQSSLSGLSVRGFVKSSLSGESVSSSSCCAPSQPSTLFAPLRITAGIKRWEKKAVKPNSLPVRVKLHVKVGDTVQVIAGSDKGKIAEVLSVFTHNSKVTCKDINIKTKHVKKRAEGESGQIIQVEAPIHSSNVMVYSRESKLASRVGHKLLEDGTKVRYLLKTGEVIDDPAKERERRLKPKKKSDSA